jgi:GPH family glycoside/pentoside/hexuronide:cation symporter
MAEPQPAQPSAAPSLRRENLPFSEVVGYGAGNFAFALLGLVVAVNLQFFYTDYVGLTAGLVSWSLLFARMFDAVTDPVMGYLSDRTNTRFGRRRPWFLGCALPLGIAFYYLFTPPVVENPAESQGFLLFYMLTLYIATYFIWTVGAVPYYSLGAELSDDYQERVRIITVREGWALAGLLVATVLPAYLIHVYGGRAGYSFMGAFLGLGTVLFLLISALTVRERAEFQGRPQMNPYRGWLKTMSNPHFRTLLVAFTASAIAGAVPAVLVIYISIYVIGTPDWWVEWVNVWVPWLPTWSFYLLVYFVSGAISLPFWNYCAGKLGKKATWAIAIVMAMIGSAGCWWLDTGTVGYFTIVLINGGVSFGNFISLPASMVADIIDHDEVDTGQRREGSYFAIWGFAIKLGNAVTGFAALQVLEQVGYVPGVEQTPTVKTWMLVMYSWFPAAFYLASLAALSRFHFTREDLDDAQRKIGRA